MFSDSVSPSVRLKQQRKNFVDREEEGREEKGREQQKQLPHGSCHSICIVNTLPESDHWEVHKFIEFVLRNMPKYNKSLTQSEKI